MWDVFWIGATAGALVTGGVCLLAVRRAIPKIKASLGDKSSGKMPPPA